MNCQQLEDIFNQEEQLLNQGLRQADEAIGARNTLSNLAKTEQTRIEVLDQALQKYLAATQLVQLVAEQVQQQITKVEQICTSALQGVLVNPALTFKVVMEKKRNGLDTSLVIDDSEVGELDIVHSEAGATKNIIAVCLRLIFTELCSPRVDGPIVLDEAGGNISVEYQEAFGKFLKGFSHSTKRQIILVSHQRDTVVREADKVFTIIKTGTKSEIHN